MDFTEIITACAGAITTLISWFLAKRKYSTEVDHSYLENLEKGLETYDTIINHNKSEIEFLMKENEDLRKELSDLRKQVLDLTLNICMDLRCDRRIREHQLVSRNKEGRTKDKLDITDSVKP